MVDPDTPPAARALLRQLESGHWWTHSHAAAGTRDCTGYGPPRGDGTRPQIAAIEQVDSFLVRAHHPDGRGFVAVWMRRPGTTPAGRPKGWSLDTAWRGRRPDEYAPKRVTATELKAYVAPVTDEIGEAA